MRKLISLLAICTTFTLAMYMGYNAASLSMTRAQPEETLAPTSSPSATQQNILLIQYDENTGSQPALQAVWLVAFFKSTNQTVISFSPLYP